MAKDKLTGGAMQQEEIILFEDAVKHRQSTYSGIKIEFENTDTVEIPIALDDWVCDFCNATLPVVAENQEKITQISLNGNQTLCDSCWKRILEKDTSLYENIKHCTCCVNPKANWYLYKEVENGFQSFMRFENEKQAIAFANTFMEITNTLTIFQKIETNEEK